MSTGEKALLFIFGAGVLALILSAAKRASDLTHVTISPVITGDELKTKKITLELVNPTSQTLTSKSLIADVVLNGNTIDTIDYVNPITIQANSKQRISLPFKTDVAGSVKSILDIFSKSQQKKTSLSVSGSVNIDDIIIPFQKELL